MGKRLDVLATAWARESFLSLSVLSPITDLGFHVRSGSDGRRHCEAHAGLQRLRRHTEREACTIPSADGVLQRWSLHNTGFSTKQRGQEPPVSSIPREQGSWAAPGAGHPVRKGEAAPASGQPAHPAFLALLPPPSPPEDPCSDVPWGRPSPGTGSESRLSRAFPSSFASLDCVQHLPAGRLCQSSASVLATTRVLPEAMASVGCGFFHHPCRGTGTR